MKKILLCKAAIVLAVTALSGGLASVVHGQTSNPPPAVPAQSAQLSPAVQEVLKLAHADVSDDTIVAYINSSGAVYNLNASDIVYLRQQGVSNPVITAMLNARPTPNAPAVAQAAPPAAPVPAPPEGTTQPPADAMQAAPIYDGSAYSAPAYSYAAPGYYGAAPYYWGYPGVSLGIGLGFGGYYGGYYGRPWGGYGWGGYPYYHGGGYHGGGYHGGFHGGGHH